MRGEHTEQVLRLVGDGVQEISDIKVSAKDRIKAAEMLAKRYGLLVDKVSVQDDSEILVKVEYEDNPESEQNI